MPPSYLIEEGLSTEGEIPFSARGFTTLWKGRWSDSRVAIKMLRLGPDDNKERIATVSRVVSGDRPQVLTTTATWHIEILQGSFVMAPPAPSERTSRLRCLDDHLPTLRSLTMDGERKHYRFHPETPRDKSNEPGQSLTSISRRLNIETVPQLIDVANGLRYLHRIDQIHGNIRGVRSRRARTGAS